MPTRPSPLASRALAFSGLLAMAAFAGTFVPGCAGPGAETGGALHYTEDAKRAYDRAMVAFNDKDWEEAIALLKEVKRKYSYSRYARLAELRIADANFESEKVAESIQAYRTFVHDHRTDDEVPYARFRLCKALFNQISDTVLLPPQEERDQATALEAYKELTSFVHDYPRGRFAADTTWMLSVVTGRLVRHELYVAHFYLRRDEFEAAVTRIQYALRHYEGSGLEAEAMVLLGETYLKMHKQDEAKASFATVLTRYPQSAFSVTARSFLDSMEQAPMPRL